MSDTSRLCVCGHDVEYHYRQHTECRVCYCRAFVRPIPNVDTTATRAPVHDPVNAPSHYTWHPDGIEQIQVSEHMPFNLGAAIKYIWRTGRKGDAIEDLRKAVWHINREIKRLGVKP